MSHIITIYNTNSWQAFAKAIALPQIDVIDFGKASTKGLVLFPMDVSDVNQLAQQLLPEQILYIACEQAEYFIAQALEQGSSLEQATSIWLQLTQELLAIQTQRRRQIRLFNLHQALGNPDALVKDLSDLTPIAINPPQTTTNNFNLLAACQYVAQSSELLAVNARLQASCIYLSDSDAITIDIPHILQESRSASDKLKKLQIDHKQQIEQLAQLQLQITNNQTSITTLEQKCSELTKETQELYRKLASTSEERELLLNQLHLVQEQLEEYYMQLQREKKDNKHALTARDKQSAKEFSKLEDSLRKARAKAASAEYAGSLLQQELNKIRNSISWKTAKPVRALGRLLHKPNLEQERLNQQIGLLLTSEFFDVDWYLKIYPDVADAKINPAEHYIRFGATEGRLPGPDFDGNWYLQQYPDVAKANMNPLLHFVMFGQQEGRTSSPKLLTQNSQEHGE